MPGTITFNVGEVRVLMAHTKAAPSHSPSYEDLYNAKYHKGGKVIKKDNWPDPENIDKSLIPAALWLIKDRGVYLMANSAPALLKDESAGTSVVAYAAEANPEKQEFDDWWETAHHIMGGDDCVITLPVGMFEAATRGKADVDTFRLKVTARTISVVK